MKLITKRAFTLIEMIATLVIISILAGTTSPLILNSFQILRNQTQHTMMVEQVTYVSKTLTRLIENALPNSFRYHDDNTLIFSPILSIVAFHSSSLNDQRDKIEFISGTSAQQAIEQEVRALNISASSNALKDTRYFVTKPQPKVNNSTPNQGLIYRSDSSSRKEIQSASSSEISFKDAYDDIFLLGQWNVGFITTAPMALKCEGNELNLYYLNPYVETVDSSNSPALSTLKVPIATNVSKCEIKFNDPDAVSATFVELLVELESNEVKSPIFITKVKVRNYA